MIRRLIPVFAACLLAGTAHAQMQKIETAYEIDGKPFTGYLVYDDSRGRLPGLLMVPNWMGPTPQSLEKAERIAAMGYIVFMADMYGSAIRPQNADEAGKAAGAVRADRPLMRHRARQGLEQLLTKAPQNLLDKDSIGAIGFCFGGGTVLELARSGAAIDGVVSFHGNLDTPDPSLAKQIQTSVLVLHGADDPYVPADQVSGFEAEMRAAGVDWQLVSYGGTVHSFTDPYAATPGQAEYQPRSAARAFTAMQNFFAERFAAP